MKTFVRDDSIADTTDEKMHVLQYSVQKCGTVQQGCKTSVSSVPPLRSGDSPVKTSRRLTCRNTGVQHNIAYVLYYAVGARFFAPPFLIARSLAP